MQLNTDRVVSLSAMLVGLGSRYHGSAIKKDPHDFFREARPQAVTGGFSVDRLIPKSGPDKAIIEITYRSVYGDRWRVMSDTVVPQAL